jgi:hypothetical protein
MWRATRITAHIVELRRNHSSNKLHKNKEETIQWIDSVQISRRTLSV